MSTAACSGDGPFSAGRYILIIPSHIVLPRSQQGQERNEYQDSLHNE
jgi:hypothetical protein